MTPRTLIRPFSSFLSILSTLTLAPLAWAAPPQIASYLDGAQVVTAERLGLPAADARGRLVTPVRIHRGGRAYTSAVDHTALVKIDPASEGALVAAGLHIEEALMPSIGLYLVSDPTLSRDGLDIAETLSQSAFRSQGVRAAAPNLYVRLEPRGMPFVPNDPRLSGQWYFGDKQTNMTEAWGITKGDPGTTIVVIDSGCDIGHPDLVDKLDPGLDVVDDDEDPSFDPTYQGAEHGTACAGLVGASTNNGVGIAGACPECRVRCVRLLTDVALPLSATIKAFEFALQTGAAVVSNSWGYAEPTPVPTLIAEAIDNVFDNGRGGKGALVVFAAGNDDRELGNDEMTAVRGALTIGAVTQFDDQTFFTNYGASVDLVAPLGTLTTDIRGAGGMDPTDYTNNFGGTSSACPVAAGIGALVASAAPEKTSQELVDLLVKNARPAPYALPDANGHDPVFGYGIVDPMRTFKALGLVDQPSNTPDPPASADESASCACRTGQGSAGPSSSLYLGALAILLASSRRRARRARR